MANISFTSTPPVPEFLRGLFMDCINGNGDINTIYGNISYQLNNYLSNTTKQNGRVLMESPTRREVAYKFICDFIEDYTIKTTENLNSDDINEYFNTWGFYWDVVRLIYLCTKHLRIESANAQFMKILDFAASKWVQQKDIINKVELYAENMLQNARNDDLLLNMGFLRQITSHVEAFAHIPGNGVAQFFERVIFATKQYYDNWAAQVQAKDAHTYAATALKKLKELDVFYNVIFSKASAAQIIHCINVSIIIGHTTVLSLEFFRLLNSGELTYEFCELIYREQSVLHTYAMVYEKYWKSVFDNHLANVPNDEEHIKCICNLLDMMQNQLSEIFKNSNVFTNAMKKSIRENINNKSRNTPIAAVEYLHSLLRKSSKIKLEDHDREIILTKVMNMMNYVDAKDLFVEHYSTKLSFRLICGDSFSDSLENSAFSLMKSNFGIEHTQKMKTMFDDIAVSNDVRSNYFKLHETNIFNPIILTKSIWKLYNSNYILPEQMSTFINAFTSYYKDIQSGRRLQWAHSASRVIISLTSQTKTPYTLTCTMEQYLVLNLFNDGYVNTSDISGRTGLDKSMISKVMDVLVGKLHILGSNKDGSKYALNRKLEDRFKSTKINCSIYGTSDSEEVKQSQETVNLQRLNLVYACIVRNMKKHKQMDNVALKIEIVSQLQHQTGITGDLIKKGIEFCIDKEFIEVAERTATNTVYKYIES